MGTLKAPFNFVPLANTVYFPEWANMISHDIPFADHVSGTIDIRVTAESPIFVRNGHTEEDKKSDNETYKSFCKTPDGKYFIPATSIKGAIRNVLEIMSFGKMTQMQNQSFGIRDLSDGTDGRFYRSKIKTDNIHCGWLKMLDENQYELEDCGLPWRISAGELDDKFGVGLVNFICDRNKLKSDENRTAAAKYALFKGIKLISRFAPDVELRQHLKVGNRQFVKFDANGAEGEIVLTGQSGVRKLSKKLNKEGMPTMEGKFYEFVFPCDDTTVVNIDKFVVKEFLSIHKNSPDYIKLWRDKLLKGEDIPVFFLYDENDKVSSMGLSYMFKYPAYNTVRNGVPNEFLDDSRLDLSECIFGTVIGSKFALKGRVGFSHAMADGEPKVLTQQEYVLSTPHQSYYPLYLGNGQTWNSDSVQLAGRKRYPVRSRIMKSTIGTGEMLSKFKPLDKGAQFTFKMRFHNLRRLELGALLSAITFHGHKECSHSIGMAKPYGFGRVKMEVMDFDIKPFLNEFEQEMNMVSGNTWQSQISELYEMAKGIPEGREAEFVYMKMSTTPNGNEFKSGKKDYSHGLQLGTFTQILQGNVPTAKFVGNVQENKERVNVDAIREKQTQFRELMMQADAQIDYSNFDEAESLLSQAEKLNINKADINDLRNKIASKKKAKRYEELLTLANSHIECNNFDEAESILAQAEEFTVSTAKIVATRQRIAAKKKVQFEDKIALSDAIYSEAKSLFEAKNHELALAKFQEVQDLGVRDVNTEIRKCNNAMTMHEQSFEDYLKEASMSSPNSLRNHLKKWKDIHGAFSEEQRNKIKQHIEVYISRLSSSKKKQWSNFNTENL